MAVRATTATNERKEKTYGRLLGAGRSSPVRASTGREPCKTTFRHTQARGLCPSFRSADPSPIASVVVLAAPEAQPRRVSAGGSATSATRRASVYILRI